MNDKLFRRILAAVAVLGSLSVIALTVYNYLYLVVAAFFLLPAAALAWFVASLVLFVKTPKDSPKRKGRKVMLIISSVVMGVLVSAFFGVLILFSLSIVHM